MTYSTLPLLLLTSLSLLPIGAPEEAAPPIRKENALEPGSFVRLVRDEDGTPRKLQTAIVRYGPVASAHEREEHDGREDRDARDEQGDRDEGATATATEDDAESALVVDLIAAVHVADRSYFKDLDELFGEYDALLYELVKPDGVALPDGTPVPADDPLSMLFSMGLDHLGLASQTDHIDYTRAHFVHADLSPAQMGAKMEERGDDALTIALGVVSDTLRAQNLLERRLAERAAAGEPAPLLAEEVDPLELLFAPDGPMRMKRLFAEQLAGEALELGLGETLETILIDDRNEACMRVFQRELAAGAKTIGIFYGAAHMSDLDRRLREEFGLERKRVVWCTAWDLR